MRNFCAGLLINYIKFVVLETQLFTLVGLRKCMIGERTFATESCEKIFSFHEPKQFNSANWLARGSRIIAV